MTVVFSDRNIQLAISVFYNNITLVPVLQTYVPQKTRFLPNYATTNTIREFTEDLGIPPFKVGEDFTPNIQKNRIAEWQDRFDSTVVVGACRAQKSAAAYVVNYQK